MLSIHLDSVVKAIDKVFLLVISVNLIWESIQWILARIPQSLPLNPII